MMSASITGIGWVTADGMGTGRSGASLSFAGKDLPELKRSDVFENPDRRFGRLDPFSKLGLAAIAFALRDAGLEEWEAKRRIGLVAATTYGCLATDTAYFDTVVPDKGAFASPQLFAYTLSNTFLGEASIRFGLTGGGMVINDPSPGGLPPLGLALESLAWGEEERVVAGFCDLAVPGGLPDVPEAAAGALFMVLEKSSDTQRPRYGLFCRDEEGRYAFGGESVSRIADLASACLNRRPLI